MKNSVNKEVQDLRSLTIVEDRGVDTCEEVLSVLNTLRKHVEVVRDGIYLDDEEMIRRGFEGYSEDSETLKDMMKWLFGHFHDEKGLYSNRKPYWLRKE